MEHRIKKIKTKGYGKAERSHRTSDEKQHIGQQAATWQPAHDPTYEPHNKKGGNGVDHIDHRQVLHAKSFKKGCFYKIIKENIWTTDEEKKDGTPEE